MAIRYNLVLAYHNNMNFMDFMKIAEKVTGIDPEIRPLVVHSEGIPPDIYVKIGEHPAFVFSPINVPAGMFPRGKIYCGRYIPKNMQLKSLKRHGLPVPRWALVEPGSRFSSAEWGPFVVTKPVGQNASFSRGIEVRVPEDIVFKERNPVQANPFDSHSAIMVHRFIDTGEFRPQNRVLTLFGKVLYGEEIRAEEPVPIPQPVTAESLAGFVITPVLVKRVRSFVHDADILALASRIYGAFPDIPLQAVDILRENKTGKLFILEINAGGDTWHFSSKFGQYQRVEGKKRDEQFDAFTIAAHVLAERTRREAI
jgi:hypothetical protein